MENFLVKTIRLIASVSFPTVLLTMTISQRPASASSIGRCVNDLIDSGVAREQAGAACSDVLYPKELSSCVGKIQNRTNIKAQDALQACYRVRRPQDLASCTIDLAQPAETPNKPPEASDKSAAAIDNVAALNNCRRSLLPKRYAECTLGLQNNAGLSSMKAMETCITAEFFPSTLSPEISQN